MKKRTALVVPCYNEENRLQPVPFKQFIAQNDTIDLWFVDDGSSDHTYDIINAISLEHPSRIFTYQLARNGGKGEAIRQCILHVLKEQDYSYVGFIDADLSAPLSEVPPLNAILLEKQHLLIVAGCRIQMAGRKIKRSLSRHYASRIFATYYTQILNVHNYDTQCGLKLFDSVFAKQLFAAPFVSRWLFDLEIFKRTQKLLGPQKYAETVMEVPLYEWKEVGGSRLRLSDFIKAPFEVFKILSHYR